jgi:hypothetical protein
VCRQRVEPRKAAQPRKAAANGKGKGKGKAVARKGVSTQQPEEQQQDDELTLPEEAPTAPPRHTLRVFYIDCDLKEGNLALQLSEGLETAAAAAAYPCTVDACADLLTARQELCNSSGTYYDFIFLSEQAYVGYLEASVKPSSELLAATETTEAAAVSEEAIVSTGTDNDCSNTDCSSSDDSNSNSAAAKAASKDSGTDSNGQYTRYHDGANLAWYLRDAGVPASTRIVLMIDGDIEAYKVSAKRDIYIRASEVNLLAQKPSRVAAGSWRFDPVLECLVDWKPKAVFTNKHYIAPRQLPPQVAKPLAKPLGEPLILDSNWATSQYARHHVAQGVFAGMPTISGIPLRKPAVSIAPRPPSADELLTASLASAVAAAGAANNSSSSANSGSTSSSAMHGASTSSSIGSRVTRKYAQV